MPSPGTRTACWPPPVLQCYLIHTTLGNEYLGSRIDEERSEIRYLVSIAGRKLSGGAQLLNICNARAQLAFKDSMVRGILQFTPGIAFR